MLFDPKHINTFLGAASAAPDLRLSLEAGGQMLGGTVDAALVVYVRVEDGQGQCMAAMPHPSEDARLPLAVAIAAVAHLNEAGLLGEALDHLGAILDQRELAGAIDPAEAN